MESSSLQELEQIPGVGKTIAKDMQNIGIHSIDDLKDKNAKQLSDRSACLHFHEFLFLGVFNAI